MVPAWPEHPGTWPGRRERARQASRTRAAPLAGDPGFRRAPVAGHRGGPACRRPGAARRHAAVHERHQHPGPGLSLMAAFDAALPALIANLAVEVAPVRVNLIAAGFVDTALSARLLGDDLDARRTQLSARLPNRARGRAGRHRPAGRAPDDQHGRHRGDLRHRRRGAARAGLMSVITASGRSLGHLLRGGAWQQRPVHTDGCQRVSHSADAVISASSSRWCSAQARTSATGWTSRSSGRSWTPGCRLEGMAGLPLQGRRSGGIRRGPAVAGGADHAERPPRAGPAHWGQGGSGH